MSGEKRFSREEAARILDSLGLSDKYDANEFYMGINVELEHGTVDPATNVSDAVSYTHLRAHETPEHLVCRLLLEKKKNTYTHTRFH